MILTDKRSLETVNRRTFLKILGVPLLATAGCRYWPRDGLSNDCLRERLPDYPSLQELLQATWEGIDTDQLWDCHTHLVGIGDATPDIYVNPAMRSPWHPIQYLQFKVYLQASCAVESEAPTIDQGVIQRLRQLHQDLPTGYRSMLLAFDYLRDEQGNPDLVNSPFRVANRYARETAETYPQAFEWIASIHPYRKDAIDVLESAVAHHARAVKWLPSVMGIDASSPRCDTFYQALVKHDLPLLTHAGDEQAVNSGSRKAYNNPLLFRRALEHGVRVIFAHCATLGESIDIDKGVNGPWVANLELFARLMQEAAWEKQLFGDIAAITQVNRDRWMIEKIIQTEEWHDRLIFGTDYPLPGALPLYSPQNFVDWGMLKASEADILSEVRRYNPILFDVMLKRLIRVNGKQFSTRVFETRRHFIKS